MTATFTEEFAYGLLIDIERAEDALSEAYSNRETWVNHASDSGLTDTAIGELLGVSRQRVAQLKDGAS